MGRRSNLSPILNVGNIITEALDKAKKGAATTNINKQTNAIIPPSIKEVDSLNAQKIIDSPELAGKWKADNQLNQKQKQIPILEEKADNLLEGKITGKEFRTEVKNVNPIEEINEIPVIPTFTDIAGSLKSNQIEKGILGLNKQIKDGTRVSSRLDIPAYEKYNKWIVSVHDAFDKKGNTDVLNGESIAYSKTIVLKDVSFKALPASASKIAAGRTDKGTIARIFGNIKNEAPESVAARAKGYLNNEEWTEIGFNPYKHGFFYNKKTGAPVSSADEVVQIGPLVLAHNVKKMTISQMKKLGPKGGLQIRAGKPIEGLKNLKETKTVFNKGGTAMKQQMEMFEDGGLRDQGDTIDPVSGNDVPSGSTQEEVRDDIPAQLSEGEFVFPADVVRFIGLEKLMMMRQEAKSGLQRMEDMGQMGNSDEAIMPDDTPFNIDDLDMEDDTVEMAQGGVINAAYGTFVNDTSNITSTPSQFAGQNLPSQENNPNAQPVSYTVPNYNNVQDGGFSPTYFNQLTPAADNVSTFKDLVGDNYGRYDEMRKYRSESGMVLSIPFKAGQPIYPIPEGYTYIDPEEVVEETPVVQSVAPRTTRVAEQDDGEPGDGGGGAVDLVGDPLSYSGIFSQDALDKTLRGYAGMQLNLGDMKGALTRGFKSQVNVNEIVLNTAREQLKAIKTQMFDPNQNLGTLNPNARDAVNKSLNRQTNSVQSLLTNTDADGNTTSVTIETLETRASAIENQAKKAGIDLTELNKKYSRVSRPSVKARDPMAMRNYAKSIALRASILNLAIVDEYQRDKGVYAEGSDDANKIIDLVKANEAKAKENFGDAPDTYTNPATGQQISDPLSDSGYESGDYESSSDYGGSESTEDQQEDAGGSFAGDDPSFNKGGLLGKKKPKPKKMKRGGLASRK